MSRSENRVELYLSYKDHKKEPGKTRPTATACSSDTLALSNSVSLLVESLANTEEEKREVISAENLLYHTKVHNKEIRRMREEYRKKKRKKEECRKCNPTEERVERSFQPTEDTDNTKR